MIVVLRPEDTDRHLAEGLMRCPDCQGGLVKWGFSTQRTVRAPGTATMTVRPQRVRCRVCRVTRVLLPTGLQVRRADTTDVIGQALVHRAHGLGVRRIAEFMGRPLSTVRRWIRRSADPAHQNRLYYDGLGHILEIGSYLLDTFDHRDWPYSGRSTLWHALNYLGAAAKFDREIFHIDAPGWSLVGLHTRGRLLSPP